MTMYKIAGRAFAYIPVSLLILLLSGCAHLGIYRLSLQGEPREGPAPLTVSFTAEISGGLDSSPAPYCHPQTWDFGEGENLTIFGLCQPWRLGMKIDRHFQRTHTYNEPGVYQASFSYGPLESKPVLVKVLE
jgi:hypothetical protein